MKQPIPSTSPLSSRLTSLRLVPALCSAFAFLTSCATNQRLVPEVDHQNTISLQTLFDRSAQLAGKKVSVFGYLDGSGELSLKASQSSGSLSLPIAYYGTGAVVVMNKKVIRGTECLSWRNQPVVISGEFGLFPCYEISGASSGLVTVIPSSITALSDTEVQQLPKKRKP